MVRAVVGILFTRPCSFKLRNNWNSETAIELESSNYSLPILTLTILLLRDTNGRSIFEAQVTCNLGRIYQLAQKFGLFFIKVFEGVVVGIAFMWYHGVVGKIYKMWLVSSEPHFLQCEVKKFCYIATIFAQEVHYCEWNQWRGLIRYWRIVQTPFI